MSTLILAGKVAGTAAVAAAALVAGVHTTGSTPTSATSTKVHCAAYAHVDDHLRADLKAMRAKPAGDERRAAAKKIRREVHQGSYGERTRVAALRSDVRRLRLRAAAPDAMKAALRSAAGQTKGTERRAAVTKVLSDAAGGTYGEDVRKIAGQAQQRREACTAKRARTTG